MTDKIKESLPICFYLSMVIILNFPTNTKAQRFGLQTMGKEIENLVYNSNLKKQKRANFKSTIFVKYKKAKVKYIFKFLQINNY